MAPGIRDMEQRHGLFDMDALLAERLALTVQLAPLDAVVGVGGTWEHQMKSLRMSIALEHRDEAQKNGQKITEAALEERACADPRYANKLAEITQMRAEWVMIRGMVDQLTAQMQWAQASVRLIAAEPRV